MLALLAIGAVDRLRPVETEQVNDGHGGALGGGGGGGVTVIHWFDWSRLISCQKLLFCCFSCTEVPTPPRDQLDPVFLAITAQTSGVMRERPAGGSRNQPTKISRRLFSPLQAVSLLATCARASSSACYKKCAFCLCELIKARLRAAVISLPAAPQQLTKVDVIRIHEKCFFLFSAGTISRRGQAGGPADESARNPFSLAVKLNLLWTLATHFKICAQ